MRTFFAWIIVVTVVIGGVYVYFASLREPLSPEEITYGATFSVLRAEELGLSWRETFDAIVDELGVRHFRFVAHWPQVEPEEGEFNFEELDYQMHRAELTGSEVILSIGRRLPSWPECHMPAWTSDRTEAEVKEAQFRYMRAVVERYKNSPALRWWQVENEPFIIGYAFEQCGLLDVEFLEKEIAFVKELDPDHPVLLTASGELGMFDNAWKRADVFGTTLYRHVWNLDLNSYLTYPTTPGFYRAKWAWAEWATGQAKPAILAELALESWTKQATVNTPLEEQLSRMNAKLFDETVGFAAATGFPEQYVWGAEWWYYLKKTHDYPELWEHAKKLFQ